MLDYYYELQIKPEKHYDIFLDLLSTLTDEAIEELDGTLISRSEEDLSDIEAGIQAFAKELNVQCSTQLTQEKTKIGLESTEKQ